MSKLFDIKGYFDSSYEYQFNDRDMWEGKILLEDDGWFEGVVKDVSSSYQEDRFVFGVYHPGKVIELFKWTPTSFSSPFVFHGNKSEVGYQGEFEVIGLMGSMPYGVSRITPEEVVLGNDEEQVEIDDVKRRIERYKVLLMDEPTSALDPISTSRIEELAQELKEKYTIVIVTHNMQQAVRISDYTAFFLLGELVEFGETERMFSQPMDKRTEDYITGRFG